MSLYTSGKFVNITSGMVEVGVFLFGRRKNSTLHKEGRRKGGTVRGVSVWGGGRHPDSGASFVTDCPRPSCFCPYPLITLPPSGPNPESSSKSEKF